VAARGPTVCPANRELARDQKEMHQLAGAAGSGPAGPSRHHGPRARVYHLSCWCRMIDLTVQEQREAIAATQVLIAARKAPRAGGQGAKATCRKIRQRVVSVTD
jgi:hypothetical protein